MIPAKYDEKGNILVDLTIIGRCDEKKEEALLDTGFSGSLAIPISVGCEVGLTPVGKGRVIIASGEAINVPLFIGKLGVGTEVIDCIYLILAGAEEILVGMDVLKDYNVQFHAAKRSIRILKGEEQLSKVEEEIEAITPVEEEVEEILPGAEEVQTTPEPSRMDILKKTLREVVPR